MKRKKNKGHGIIGLFLILIGLGIIITLMGTCHS
jgi:hypothetical protein